MLQRIVAEYDRRPMIVRSLFWGVLVFVAGVIFNMIFREIFYHYLKLKWIEMMLISNFMDAMIVTIAARTVLVNRERRMRRRFKEIGYLNHHSRNALMTIEMAVEHVDDLETRKQMVRTQSTRIQRCLEKISRQEDLEDINTTPGEIK